MWKYFLSKNVAKVGDEIQLHGDCLLSAPTFQTSDDTVANFSGSGYTIIANNIGTSEISENTSPLSVCDNLQALTLTVTEDGNAPLIGLKDYEELSSVYLALTCLIMVVAFFLNFWRK